MSLTHTVNFCIGSAFSKGPGPDPSPSPLYKVCRMELPRFYLNFKFEWSNINFSFFVDFTSDFITSVSQRNDDRNN